MTANAAVSGAPASGDVPALRPLDGHRGAYVLRREVDQSVDFLVVTVSQTLDAVRAFADDVYEDAVVPPEALAPFPGRRARSTTSAPLRNGVAGGD